MHVFEVMAEPIRRCIVEMLASGPHESGVITSEVSRQFGVSRAAGHHHLAVLRRHGAVTTRDDWPYREYLLERAFLLALDRELERIAERWRIRIEHPDAADVREMPFVPTQRGYRGRGQDPDDPIQRRFRDS